MTEIPAKTPNPIGSTDSFLPGRANAAVAEPDSSAAAADTDEVDAAESPCGCAAPVIAEVGTADTGPFTTIPP